MRRAGTMLVLSRLAALLAALTAFHVVAAAAAPAPRLLLFPFELIDVTTSASAYGYDAPGGLPTGPSKAETDRLALITGSLAERIEKDGRYALVKTDTVASVIAEKAPISQCNGCEDDIAKAAGAQLALIATVEKLSDLLFNFKLYLRDIDGGKVTAVMGTTIQGSTDEAWLRGIRYLAERQLLTGEASVR